MQRMRLQPHCMSQYRGNISSLEPILRYQLVHVQPMTQYRENISSMKPILRHQLIQAQKTQVNASTFSWETTKNKKKDKRLLKNIVGVISNNANANAWENKNNDSESVRILRSPTVGSNICIKRMQCIFMLSPMRQEVKEENNEHLLFL